MFIREKLIMKSTQLFMGAIVFSSLLCCKESPKKAEADLATVSNNAIVDSIRVNDSVKVSDKLSLLYNKKILVFNDVKDQNLLDSIYGQTYLKISSFDKKGLLAALESDKKTFLTPDPEMDLSYVESPQQWDEDSDMKLFSEINDFKIVKYTSSGYSGGAHGYYNEIYKVFDFNKNKTIGLLDVVKDNKDPNWSKLLMKAYLANGEESEESLLVNEIPLNSNFYFDKTSITFVYNQYEITSYAAGVQYLKLPIKDIQQLLNNDFLLML